MKPRPSNQALVKLNMSTTTPVHCRKSTVIAPIRAGEDEEAGLIGVIEAEGAGLIEARGDGLRLLTITGLKLDGAMDTAEERTDGEGLGEGARDDGAGDDGLLDGLGDATGASEDAGAGDELVARDDELDGARLDGEKLDAGRTLDGEADGMLGGLIEDDRTLDGDAETPGEGLVGDGEELDREKGEMDGTEPDDEDELPGLANSPYCRPVVRPA